MKPSTMILGFLPWIAFGIVVQLIGPQSVALSALLGVGLVLAGVAVTRELRSPNQMAVGSLIPLSTIALVALTTGDDVHEWLFTWAVPGQALVLGAFLLAMLPIAPFTQRYARSVTPRAYWTSPLFVRTNLIISAAWGIAMVALGACNILGSAMEAYADEFGELAQVQPFLGLASLAVIAGIITFTRMYPARVRHLRRPRLTPFPPYPPTPFHPGRPVPARLIPARSGPPPHEVDHAEGAVIRPG